MVNGVYSIEDAIALVKDPDLKEELEYQLRHLKENQEKEIDNLVQEFNREIDSLNLELDVANSRLEEI